MLADPFVLGSDSLPAVSRGPNESVYMKDDGSLKITVGHQFKAERSRFVMRLDALKTTTDPFNADRNIPVGMSTYVVVDKPTVGFTNAEAALWCYKLIAQISDGTPNIITKVVGGQT